MTQKLIIASLAALYVVGFSSVGTCQRLNAVRHPLDHKFSYTTLSATDEKANLQQLRHFTEGQCVHPAPPRGWDSFDYFPIPVTFNEQALIQQAQLLSQYLGNNTPGVYKYLIIDEGWAEVGIGQWMLDRWGRPVPNTLLFPSSAETGGFGPLVTTLKQLYGLDLGLWIIKGIPKMAVDMKLPIKGTDYTADQIALPSQRCPWHKDVFAINMSHPGGQAYYDSLAELYVGEWGVTYIKIDCIFGTNDLDAAEVNGFSMAMNAVNPAAIVSLSPGDSWNNTLVDTAHASNLYRITGDLHDCWSTQQSPCSGHPIVQTTQTLIDVQPYLDGIKVVPTQYDRRALHHRKVPASNGATTTSVGSYPDPDMIPLGTIRVGHNNSQAQTSYVTTPGMSRYIYGMWSITRSPMILGGDLNSLVNTNFLYPLLSNPYLAAMHQCSANPTVLFKQSQDVSGDHGIVVWGLQHGAVANILYVGCFAYSDNTTATYTETISLSMEVVANSFAAPNADVQYFQLVDLLTGSQIGGSVNYVQNGTFPAISVPANDAMLLAILAFS